MTGPRGGANCAQDVPGSFVSGGYNRISDATCLTMTQATDKDSITILLGAPDYNGGSTLNYLPQGVASNSILDIIPETDCGLLLDAVLKDQRGRNRPYQGWAGGEQKAAYCDAGASSAARRSGRCAGRH